MDSPLQQIPNGGERTPQARPLAPWWEVSYRWLGWLSGLIFLSLGLPDLRSDFASGRIAWALCHIGMTLMGMFLLSAWIVDLLEWRRGGRLMSVRYWFLPVMLALPLLFLASGVAWWLGY